MYVCTQDRKGINKREARPKNKPGSLHNNRHKLKAFAHKGFFKNQDKRQLENIP